MNEHTAADQTPDTPESGASSGCPPEALADKDREIAALRQDLEAAQDQLKRSLADLANVRRRHAQDMQQVRAMAVESLARELLPVLDNFHLALETHDQRATGGNNDSDALVQGLRMVRNLLESALERHGVREIHGHGHPFDPNKHEAVGLDAGADVAPGHVAKVLQRGYFLAERVLRPSRVLVRDQRDAQDSGKTADS